MAIKLNSVRKQGLGFETSLARSSLSHTTHERNKVTVTNLKCVTSGRMITLINPCPRHGAQPKDGQLPHDSQMQCMKLISTNTKIRRFEVDAESRELIMAITVPLIDSYALGLTIRLRHQRRSSHRYVHPPFPRRHHFDIVIIDLNKQRIFAEVHSTAGGSLQKPREPGNGVTVPVRIVVVVTKPCDRGTRCWLDEFKPFKPVALIVEHENVLRVVYQRSLRSRLSAGGEQRRPTPTPQRSLNLGPSFTQEHGGYLAKHELINAVA